MEFFRTYFDDIAYAVKNIEYTDLEQAAIMVERASQNNKKIIIAGNGGSAAMASHVAVDFTKAAQTRAINFNESDLITCFANDYGYENWVKEALNSYADHGDLVLLISSSGRSENITNAAKRAKELGLGVITLSGFSSDNPLRALGDINFWIDSSNYNYVEMTHHIWLLSIVDFIISRKS